MRSATSVLVTVLLVMCGTGCTLHPEDEPLEPESTVRVSVAQQQVGAAARGAIAYAIGPGVALDDLDGNGNPLTITCSRFSQAPPGSPVSKRYAYRVRGVVPSRVPQHLARFAAYLREHGWTRADRGSAAAVAFERGPYSMSLTWAASTRLLSLGYSTGCLRRD